MERPTMIDLSADAIGSVWTQENHQALVCHLKAVEKLAQDVIALRERERAGVPRLEFEREHYHAAKYDGEVLLDECSRCGLDLRDPIHLRIPTEPAVRP